ncbi:rod shape-determining protein MreB [Catalinimonas alkaloidigena]|uniref:rod shape-determining protein n=1 Tax=Catalinimonas alkaloidigena TaxID=1075417 RepID=UPI0024063C8B|nr:rod shape-determining protein [Catalinimonas alkaloidigena]MDF9801377.1 rod shape-determining protein MreB [Catalinimonas alkaloidigena]
MFNISLRRGNSLGLDLGNSNTIFTEKEGDYFTQPSFIALHKDKKAVKAVGQEAYDMLGKASEQFKIVKPLKGGVIMDYDSANCMVKSMIKNHHSRSSFFYGFDNVVAGIPYDTTEVEKRALRDVLEQFKAHRKYLIFEPIAAAIGMGLDIQEPDGKFLVDIGGGVTEIVIISLSGIVSHQSIKIAGDTFDEDIQNYFRKRYNMSIGSKVAEQLKIKVGSATDTPEDVPEPYQMIGKNLMTGLPVSIEIGHSEVANILDSTISKIEDAILQALETCEPELAGDIYGNGIYLTGGGSLLRGLKQRLKAKTKLQVQHDVDALQSVIRGIARVIHSPKLYQAVLFQ